MLSKWTATWGYIAWQTVAQETMAYVSSQVVSGNYEYNLKKNVYRIKVYMSIHKMDSCVCVCVCVCMC